MICPLFDEFEKTVFRRRAEEGMVTGYR